MAKVTYHKSHSYTQVENDLKIVFATQLYQIGVYGIVNNNPQMQGNFKPQLIAKMEKDLKAKEKEEIIKDLKFGELITVSDKSGFWEEQ